MSVPEPCADVPEDVTVTVVFGLLIVDVITLVEVMVTVSLDTGEHAPKITDINNKNASNIADNLV